MRRFGLFFLRLFRPGKYGELKGGQVGIGEGITSVKDVTHPFKIQKGWRQLELRVDEAEALKDWLTEQLDRDDVRRPITITIGTS